MKLYIHVLYVVRTTNQVASINIKRSVTLCLNNNAYNNKQSFNSDKSKKLGKNNVINNQFLCSETRVEKILEKPREYQISPRQDFSRLSFWTLFRCLSPD